MGRVEKERGVKKGPSPERISQLVEEAREVAARSGCSVTITVPGENGTAVIPIGNTPALSALAPEQQHVIFAPEGTQVISAEASRISIGNGQPTEPESKQERVVKPKKQRLGKPHDFTGFTGFWRGTYYRDGVSQNGKNGRGNHKK